MKNWKVQLYINIMPVLFLTAISSCLNGTKPTESKIGIDSMANNDLGFLQIEGDSVLIPDFEIEVRLSPNAEKKLKDDKETVIVSAMFSGIPKDTTSEDYQGQIGIKNYNIELTGQRIGQFTKIKFHRSILDKLADNDIYLLINVYSGRRSTENNLLDCEILEDKMSVIKGKKFILKGKLIGEDQ